MFRREAVVVLAVIGAIGAALAEGLTDGLDAPDLVVAALFAAITVLQRQNVFSKATVESIVTEVGDAAGA